MLQLNEPRLRIALVANPIPEYLEGRLIGFYAGCRAFIVGAPRIAVMLRSQQGLCYVAWEDALEASERFRDYLEANPAAFASRALDLVAVR